MQAVLHLLDMATSQEVFPAEVASRNLPVAERRCNACQCRGCTRLALVWFYIQSCAEARSQKQLHLRRKHRMFRELAMQLSPTKSIY